MSAENGVRNNGARDGGAGAGSEAQAVQTKALVGLVVALALAVAGWFWLDRAADRGIARLAAIDVARTRCEGLWQTARTRAETVMVDRTPLADTIDPMSDNALARCGDLRAPEPATALPNNREMSGEPMPRGLR